MSDQKFPQPSVILPPVPDNVEREWQVYVDGKLMPDVRHVRLEDRVDGYRSFEYGLVESEGNSYDSIGYYEAGGGGSVVIPFTMIWNEALEKNKLYIGVVRQQRLFMGPEPVLCAVGGYMRPGCTHKEIAEEELHDELRAAQRIYKGELFPLPGAPGNCNRAIWIAAGPDEGIHYSAVSVNEDALVRPGWADVWQLRPEAVSNAPDVEPTNREKVISTLFIPVHEALLLADQFVVVGAARLMAYFGHNFNLIR